MSQPTGHLTVAPSSGHAYEPPSDWTAAELALWDALRSGNELDLRDQDPTRNNPADGADWQEARTIRASVIAQLLLSTPAIEPGNPPRLRLAGAHITGFLDLGCGEPTAFLFRYCRFDQIPNLNDATASFVGFAGCFLPGLSASRLTCSGPVWMMRVQSSGSIDFSDANIRGEVDFSNANLSELDQQHRLCLCNTSIDGDVSFFKSTISGTIGLADSQISGDVIFNGAALRSSGTAVIAKQSNISGTVLANNDFKCNGAVDFEGAHIGGQLRLGRAHISRPGGVALSLDHAKIELGLLGKGLHVEGQTFMHHAWVGCQISFGEVNLVNPGEIALRADHIVVDGSLIIKDAKVDGQINLHGAKISCAFEMPGTTIIARKKLALRADAIQVTHNIIGRGCRIEGGIDFSDSSVNGSVSFSGSTIEDSSEGFTFDARRIHIGGRLDFTNNFTIKGSISLADGRIDTSLVFSDAKLQGSSKLPCLNAAGLRVQGDIIGVRARVDGLLDFAGISCMGDIRLADSILTGTPANTASMGSPIDQAKGSLWRGISLRLNAAEVRGELDARGALLSQSLVLSKIKVGRSILLEGISLGASSGDSMAAIGANCDVLDIRFKSSPTGGIDISSATVATLVDSETSWPSAAAIKIDGFKYNRLETDLSPSERLEWLSRATPKYTPQPYEQLAAYYVANGSADEARKVNLASIRRSYQSRGLPIQLWGKIQDWSLGFGYQPIRAGIIFVVLWIGASLWFTYAVGPCVRFGTQWSNLCPNAATGHPSWNPWLYSFDLLIPIMNLGYKTAWSPTGVSQLIAFILIIIGWVLTTTIVAAVGRTLRRP